MRAERKRSEEHNESYIDSMAADASAIYLHDYNNQCVWVMGLADGTTTSFVDQVEEADGSFRTLSALAAQGGEVYALESRYVRDAAGMLCYAESRLYALKPVENGEMAHERRAAFDLSAAVVNLEGWGDELSACAGMVLREDALYCLFAYSSALVRISFSDGRCETLSAETPLYLSEYDAQSMLVLNMDSGDREKLSIYDPAANTFEDLARNISGAVSGIVYRPEDAGLYALSNGTVYRISAQDPGAGVREMGTTGMLDAVQGMALADGRLAWCTHSAVSVVQMDGEAAELQTLRYSMVGSFSDETISAYTRERQNLRMEYVPRTDGEIIDNMLMRSDAVDVYTLSIADSAAYRSLFERGYFAPLESTALQTQLDELYPFLQRVVARDGVYWALPISMNAPVMQPGVNRALLERLGLTAPDSFSALLDLLEGGLPGEDCYLLAEDEAGGLEEELFSLLMSAYSAAMNSGSGPEQYNTPELTALLERLQRLDYARLREESAAQDVPDEKILLTLSQLVNCRVNSTAFEPLPLAVSSGQAAYIYADITLLCINPYSPNREAALDFLEFTASRLSALDRAQLFQNEAAPIENPDYAALKQSYEEERMRREAVLQAAEEIDRPNLQAELDRYIESGTQALAAQQWLVTEDSLRAFRARLDSFVPLYNEGISEENSAELGDLNTRYFEGSLSIEAYLTGLDREIRMRRLEEG